MADKSPMAHNPAIRTVLRGFEYYLRVENGMPQQMIHRYGKNGQLIQLYTTHKKNRGLKYLIFKKNLAGNPYMRGYEFN